MGSLRACPVTIQGLHTRVYGSIKARFAGPHVKYDPSKSCFAGLKNPIVPAFLFRSLAGPDAEGSRQEKVLRYRSWILSLVDNKVHDHPV